MDKHKPVAGLLIASAFVAGVGTHEFAGFQIQQDQKRVIQRSSSQAQMLLIGRHDHGPEQRPRAVQTFQGVQTLITTPAANRFVQFDTLLEKSAFTDHLLKPVTYSGWIR